MESWSNTSYQIDLFAEETAFYNRIVLGSLLPDNAWSPLPHLLQSWLRNFIGGTLLYLLSASLWCLYIYRIKRSVSKVPSNKAMATQVLAAMKGMPWYTLLPTVTEYVVEKGYTKCYPAINDVGWISYLMYTLIYLVLVEFAMYWSHRVLHDVKPLYKHLHSIHHMYNKQSTLSPFAGLAFHPADGVLGAMPHGMALFVVPTHFRTHIALFFVEAIWTANIHDCIDGKVWPVMGAGYHSIHHTTYRHNYGHYTVCMDWMFGTLRYPAAAAAIDEKENRKSCFS